MSKHVLQGDCPLCAEKLKDLHPVLVVWFTRVKQAFPDVHVSCTFRGELEQDQAFLSGASKVRWPNSMHNKRPARAMDLFQIRLSDKVPSWQWKYFNEIATWLHIAQAPVEWGYGLWRWDAPHFQLKPGVP